MSEPDEHRDRAAEMLVRAVDGEQSTRWLGAVAALREALVDLGLTPVIVGGLAVRYWTNDAFATVDIDVLLPGSNEVDDRLRDLGFERRGRHWRYPGTDIQIEMPGSGLDSTMVAITDEVEPGMKFEVLSLEDVLADRLRAFLFWEDSDAANQAIVLLGHEDLDQERLARITTHERYLAEGVAELRRWRDTHEDGTEIDPAETHELAQSIKDSGSR